MPPEVGSVIIPVLFFARFALMPLSLMAWDGVSSTAKLVWSRIAHYAGRDGVAYASLRRLAKDVGRSQSATEKAIKQLVDAGLVQKKPGTGRTTTRYELLFHEIFKGEPVKTMDSDAPQLRVVKNDDPAQSGGVKNCDPKAHEGPTFLRPYLTKMNDQKRTSSKKSEEKRKAVAESLDPDREEWCELQLIVDVYKNNFGEEDAEARRSELESVVAGGGPVDLVLGSLRGEVQKIKQMIGRLPGKAKTDCLTHLRQASLKRKDLESFLECFGEPSGVPPSKEAEGDPISSEQEDSITA